MHSFQIFFLVSIFYFLKHDDVLIKCFSILQNFGTRLEKLEKAVIPVHRQTKDLQRLQENIDKVMSSIDNVISYHNVVKKNNAIINFNLVGKRTKTFSNFFFLKIEFWLIIPQNSRATRNPSPTRSYVVMDYLVFPAYYVDTGGPSRRTESEFYSFFDKLKFPLDGPIIHVYTCRFFLLKIHKHILTP